MATELLRYLVVKFRYPKVDIRTPWVRGGVSFGRGCKILRDAEINSGVSIGDYSYVNAGSLIGSGSIGKFCSIGYRCQIGMPEHPTDFLSTSSRMYSHGNIFGVPPLWNDYPSPPVIENDVWIGSAAIVGQKIHIGNGAIIAAGAVVTHDVSDYAIVAGVPAREIRKRFDEATIRILLESKWWDKSIDDIVAMKEIFTTGSGWIRLIARI